MPAMVANNGNAMTLWNAGLIAATNAPITANFENLAASLRERPLPTSDMDDVAQLFAGPDGGGRWSTPILHNVAMKGGYNAIRLFLELKWVGGRHEVSILAELGREAVKIKQPAKTAWDDSTVQRAKKPAEPDIIPRYDLLAAQINNILEQCAQLGMGVILTLGDFNSGAKGSLWSSEEQQNDLVMFWELTAQRWAGYDALIGYELINEPEPGILDKETEPKSMTYNDMRNSSDLKLNNYKALVERCVAAIRESDKVTPIIVSSPSIADPAAMDYFMGTDSEGNSLLIQDTCDRIVYTVHCYAPTRYTHQGIFPGTFHSTGLCYPNLIGVQLEDRNGQSNRPAYDFRNRDITSGGMAQIFANVAKFRRDYNRPVFVGEFSACSSAFLERLSTGTAPWLLDKPTSEFHPFGSSHYVPRSDPSRAIVGMHYDQGKKEGFLIMRGAIALYDITSTDADNRPRQQNTVDLVIDPRQNYNPETDKWAFEDRSTLQGWGDLGTLKDVTLEGVWYGYDVNTAPHQGENCLIRFRWPDGKSAPAATSLGLSLTKTDPVTGLTVLKTPSELIGYIRGLDKALDDANKKLSEDPDNNVKIEARNAAQAAVDALVNIASINIVLSPERVKAQEASRVDYARDVLRQCAQLGLSWAWHADDDLVGQFPYGPHFWQVDNPVMPLAGANGRLRALLRRSAHQSYEN